MGTNTVATIGCISLVGIVGLSVWHVGAHQRRPGWDWRRARRLFISSAVCATAVLAGCSSGSTAGNSAASTPGTAASPTPTTTRLPAAAGSGRSTAAACVTSAVRGACGPYRYSGITNSDGQNTFVAQDVWNTIPGWSQTLYATSPDSWYVAANMPAGNTAVVSFPDVGQEYYYKNTL